MIYIFFILELTYLRNTELQLKFYDIEMKMASVKELINTSLENKIYTTELVKNDHWNEATNKIIAHRDNKVTENRERSVTFVDENNVPKYSIQREPSFFSTNYK